MKNRKRVTARDRFSLALIISVAYLMIVFGFNHGLFR